MKVCKRCGEEKPHNEYNAHPHTKDKLQRVCRDCSKVLWKLWYPKNKKRLADKQRANSEKMAQKAANWRAKNPRKQAIIQKKYKEEHRAILAARQKMRECLKASPISLLYDEQISKFYEEAERTGLKTGIKQHVDHIIPLQGKIVSGLHVPWNLQVLPAVENLHKGNKVQA
jgi:hypothetical protein